MSSNARLGRKAGLLGALALAGTALASSGCGMMFGQAGSQRGSYNASGQAVVVDQDVVHQLRLNTFGGFFDKEGFTKDDLNLEDPREVFPNNENVFYRIVVFNGKFNLTCDLVDSQGRTFERQTINDLYIPEKNASASFGRFQLNGAAPGNYTLRGYVDGIKRAEKQITIVEE